MKRTSITFSALAVILLGILLPGAYASDIIRWYHADFPPAFILSGPDKGTGYCDRMEKDVVEALDAYQHLFTTSNYKRIVTSIKEQGNACCPSLYKTAEREKFTTYSQPLFVGFSNGIIIPRKTVQSYRQYITPKKAIDLEGMLQKEKDIRIGVIMGRNYGESIEKVIAPYRKTGIINERSSGDSLGLVRMMMQGRIDMILALPMEIAYAVRELGYEKNSSIFFPLKDGKQYTISYMACSKNPWGEAVIGKINEVIDEKGPVFAGYYKSWLDEEGAKTYDALVKEVLGYAPAE